MSKDLNKDKVEETPQEEAPESFPVTFRDGDKKVTVNTPVTATHVLASQGIVEFTNADGSKSQMSKEQAEERLAQLESLQEALGGSK